MKTKKNYITSFLILFGIGVLAGNIEWDNFQKGTNSLLHSENVMSMAHQMTVDFEVPQELTQKPKRKKKKVIIIFKYPRPVLPKRDTSSACVPKA